MTNIAATPPSPPAAPRSKLSAVAPRTFKPALNLVTELNRANGLFKKSKLQQLLDVFSLYKQHLIHLTADDARIHDDTELQQHLQRELQCLSILELALDRFHMTSNSLPLLQDLILVHSAIERTWSIKTFSSPLLLLLEHISVEPAILHAMNLSSTSLSRHFESKYSVVTNLEALLCVHKGTQLLLGRKEVASADKKNTLKTSSGATIKLSRPEIHLALLETLKTHLKHLTSQISKAKREATHWSQEVLVISKTRLKRGITEATTKRSNAEKLELELCSESLHTRKMLEALAIMDVSKPTTMDSDFHETLKSASTLEAPGGLSQLTDMFMTDPRFLSTYTLTPRHIARPKPLVPRHTEIDHSIFHLDFLTTLETHLEELKKRDRETLILQSEAKALPDSAALLELHYKTLSDLNEEITDTDMIIALLNELDPDSDEGLHNSFELDGTLNAIIRRGTANELQSIVKKYYQDPRFAEIYPAKEDKEDDGLDGDFTDWEFDDRYPEDNRSPLRNGSGTPIMRAPSATTPKMVR